MLASCNKRPPADSGRLVVQPPSAGIHRGLMVYNCRSRGSVCVHLTACRRDCWLLSRTAAECDQGLGVCGG